MNFHIFTHFLTPASITGKPHLSTLFAYVLFKLFNRAEYLFCFAIQDAGYLWSVALLGMCICLGVEVYLITVRTIYLNLGDLSQVVRVYLAHRFILLLTPHVWTGTLILQPFADTPFASMMKTGATTSCIKNDVVTDLTNVLQVDWVDGGRYFELYI